MKINTLFFGIVTDLVGTNQQDFIVDENTSVANFKLILKEKYPKLENINSYAIAVNETYVNDVDILKDSDIVAIIPPVSGG